MNVTMKHDGILLRILRTRMRTTADPEVAEASHWVWSERLEKGWNGSVREMYVVYDLTPLGVLHALIGLTVVTK